MMGPPLGRVLPGHLLSTEELQLALLIHLELLIFARVCEQATFIQAIFIQGAEPAKRAAALSLRCRPFHGLANTACRELGACAPGFILPPAPQVQRPRILRRLLRGLCRSFRAG